MNFSRDSTMSEITLLQIRSFTLPWVRVQPGILRVEGLSPWFAGISGSCSCLSVETSRGAILECLDRSWYSFGSGFRLWIGGRAGFSSRKVPWDWNIYLHMYHENQENVGKYTSPMDSMREGVSNSTPSFCGMVAVFFNPGRCSRVEFIPRFFWDATLDTFSIQRFVCQKFRIHESEYTWSDLLSLGFPKGSL